MDSAVDIQDDQAIEERILVLSPTARDAKVTREIFSQENLPCMTCESLEQLCDEMRRGCGAILVTQEALHSAGSITLDRFLDEQPPWSDVPIVVMTVGGSKAPTPLKKKGHITLIQRPVRIAELLSNIRSALRDRRRQYEMRDYFLERERYAARLERSEEDLRLMVESARDYAIVSLDPTGNVSIWNSSAERLFGYRNDEIVGKPARIIFTSEDQARGIPESLLQSAREKSHVEDERWYLRKDGSRFFANVVTTPIVDSTGNLRGFTTMTRDITERKRSDAALGERDRQLRFALEVGRLGSWHLDLRTQTFSCSDTCKENYGRSLSAEFTYEQLLDSIHPDDRSRVSELTTTAVVERKDYECEYRVIWADGTIHWVSVRGRPERDIFGMPRRLTGLSLDITERARASEEREQLFNRERRLSKGLRRLAEVASMITEADDVDAVMRIVTEESQKLFDATSATASIVSDDNWRSAVNYASKAGAEPLEHFIGVPDGLGLYGLINSSRKPRRMNEAELRAHCCVIDDDGSNDSKFKDSKAYGAERPPYHGWLGVPILNRNGRSLGVLELCDKQSGDFDSDDEAMIVQLAQMASVAIDKTKFYEKLRANDQRKDEFLAMLAHELRNPLASISNAVQVSRVTGLKEELEWSMEVIGRQIKHLSRLIDDLLDVSRITRGKIQLRKETIDSRQVIERAVEAVKPVIESRKHKLKVIYPHEPLWLEADPTRLEQIVVNLLTNAAKYSDNGADISLIAETADGEITIEIRDTGMGIAKEKLPQMFELFAQGDRSLARSEGGLGIGLTLVRSLTEMHGGNISAASEGPGKGSQFTVRLPETKPSTSKSSDFVLPRPTAPNSCRILVVDANQDTARGVATLLRLLGHQVQVAQEGVGAVEIAARYHPEYVLLDMGLPGMSAYEIVEAIRLEDWADGTRFIALAGYDEKDAQANASWFDHHLVKPLDHDELLSLLTNDRAAA